MLFAERHRRAGWVIRLYHDRTGSRSAKNTGQHLLQPHLRLRHETIVLEHRIHIADALAAPRVHYGVDVGDLRVSAASAVSAVSAAAATSSRRGLIYQCPPRFVDRNSIWQPAQVPEARDHHAFADHGN
jgi:hypothetical protein